MKKYIFTAIAVATAFIAGMEFDNWYYNWDSLHEANEFKREYIQYLDGASMKLDSIIDVHADDGTWDEQVEELYNAGYYKLIEKVDSMAETQI